MGELIYASNTSLDGFTEDADGGFNWAPPNEVVFDTITGVMASASTYLYGRRMYETMSPWETDAALVSQTPRTEAFGATWQAADKVVYSTTLDAPLTAKTRLERTFVPDAVRSLKAASPGRLLVGGPHLAAQAFAAGLVDEVELFVWPVLLGGRNPALQADVRADLQLIGQRVVGDGVLHLSYRVA